MPAGESALGELSAATQVARALRPLAPGLQLFLPRHRLEVPVAPEPLAAELHREWPGEDGALLAALRELEALFEDGGRLLSAAPALPPRGVFARIALRRAVARAVAPGRRPIEEARPFESLDGHPFPAALLALLPFLSHLDGPPAPLTLARVLGGALRGLHVADGGEQALRELFRRRSSPNVANHDQTSALRGVVESVELSGGRIKGLRLAGSADLHAASVFVLASGGEGFARLLPQGAPGRAVAALTRLRATRRILTVNFVVRAAALPPPLGTAALSLLDGEPLLLQVEPARRQDLAEAEAHAGDRVICAAAPVPAEPWTRESVKAGADRIRSALLQAIPFFDRHVLFESIPTLVGIGDGDPFADAADPIYAPPDVAVLGVTGIPVQGTFKNLFLASREVLPGLGLEGEIYAGIEAAAHAATALGHK